MKLDPNWRAFIELLNFHEVEYVVIGAHARAFHGVPRSTGDIDFLVRTSPENAGKLVRVLDAFGFGSLGIVAEDFLHPDRIIQLGHEPLRIDLVTSISGVTFEEAWTGRLMGELGGLPVPFLSLANFRKNKRASGRPKDLADLDAVAE